MAASSITYTQEDFGGKYTKIVITCVGDSTNGSFVSTAVACNPGYIVRVVTNPGGTAPTDQYDITLTDADGVDVMGGALANRHTTTSEQAYASVAPIVAGGFTVNISNTTVNSAQIVINVYMVR